MSALLDSSDGHKRVDELPVYTVRVSQRAKRMHLKVSPIGRVEVVIPRGYDPRCASEFVSKHQYWLNRTLDRLKWRHGDHLGGDVVLPARILLRAVGEQWSVAYRSGLRCRAKALKHANGQLLLQVSSLEKSGSQTVLRTWLSNRAKYHLVPWLYRLSEELGLPIAKVSVRGQKTRWGSCSSCKNISINRKLLFLPAHLVRYLFVHELCHTVYLNHSHRYWALVGKYQPGYRDLDIELRHADSYVPLWAYPE